MQSTFIEIRRHTPPFDPAIWLAKKYRLTPSRARLIAELAGLGNIHREVDTSKIGGIAR